MTLTNLPGQALNKRGDRRGMRLRETGAGEATQWKPGQSGNPKGQSITARQEAMLNEMCPYFPDKTWREALADAGMRQALNIPVALSNFQDRHEGKVTQPIGGDADKPILIKLLSELIGNKEE